jgi:hypothetical protein
MTEGEADDALETLGVVIVDNAMIEAIEHYYKSCVRQNPVEHTAACLDPQFRTLTLPNRHNRQAFSVAFAFERKHMVP